MSGIARIMLARGIPVSGSDAKDVPRPARRCAALGADVHVGHDAAHVGDADTVVVSVGRSATTTPSSSRPAAAGCGCCTARQALAVGDGRPRAWSRSPAPTARPPPPRCSPSRCSTAAPTRRSPSAASSPSPAPTPHDGTGDVFVAEADESDGSFLPTAPDVAVVTNVEADHLDNYGTVEAVAGGLRGVRRVRRPTAGSWSPAPTTPGRAALAERGAGRGRAPCAPTATTPDADLRRRRACGSHGPRHRGRRCVHDGVGACSTCAMPGRPQRAQRRAPRSLAGLVGLGPTRTPAARRAGRLHRHPPAVRAQGRGRRRPRLRRLRPPPRPRSPRTWHGARDRGRRRAGSSSCSSRTCTRAPATSRPSSAPRSALADEVVVMDVYAAREDPDARRHRRPGRRRRAPLPGPAHGARRARPGRRPSRRWSTRARPGDLCSPSAPATSPPLGAADRRRPCATRTGRAVTAMSLGTTAPHRRRRPAASVRGRPVPASGRSSSRRRAVAARAARRAGAWWSRSRRWSGCVGCERLARRSTTSRSRASPALEAQAVGRAGAGARRHARWPGSTPTRSAPGCASA